MLMRMSLTTGTISLMADIMFLTEGYQDVVVECGSGRVGPNVPGVAKAPVENLCIAIFLTAKKGISRPVWLW